jgi:hypothetical protein
VDLSKLTLGEKILAGCGIALFIFMLVLDWHNVDLGFVDVGIKAMSSDGEAIGFLGILAFLVNLAVVGTLIAKIVGAKLPDLPIPWNQAWFYGSVATAALLLLKLIFKFDFIAFGAYLMILVAAGGAYGGFLISKQSDTGSAPSGPATPF